MAEFFIFIKENLNQVGQQTLEHIQLTLISLALSTFMGVSIGVLIALKKQLSNSVLGIVNIIQTIPSLALLGFLLPFLGIGVVPAVIALFLYALLPIVRNTYTGILEVHKAVIESAVAMGMNKTQLLFQIQLPLALPYIMAGIRTASVINVGVATLSAFIAAGGLGKFILQGIQLNNANMILAGAIPASLLALLFDSTLGLIQKLNLKKLKRILIFSTVIIIFFVSAWASINFFKSNQNSEEFIAGFPTEFIYREDGLKKLEKVYAIDFDYVEMEIGLMYKALAEGEVDLISGFSTDGRINAYNLSLLQDDKNFFPPYQAVPLVRNQTLNQYPDLEKALGLLNGIISNAEMIDLNYRVDELGEKPAEVARDFLDRKGLLNNLQKIKATDKVGEVIIGSKAFTENYILAHQFKEVIRHHTALSVTMKTGFGGTKLVMDALENGDIDLYPEYTGTALMLLLETPENKLNQLLQSPEQVLEYVSKEAENQFNYSVMPVLGFNNTFALMVRKETAKNKDLKRISDLKNLFK